MAYPTRYYDMQRQVMRDIGYAVGSGLCPVCRVRPRSRWRDTGGLRITCGANSCFMQWLPIHTPTKENTNADPT